MAALLVFLLVVDPALKRAGELKRLIPQKERELNQLRLLQKELESLKEARAAHLQRSLRGRRPCPPFPGWTGGSNGRACARA